MARARTTTRTTTNREEIRRWVESKGGWPAHVKGTGRGSDPGILRIDFPGFSGVETLGKLSWDDWFKWFDKKKLAFVHQPNTRFSKLVARETAAAKADSPATPRRAVGAKRATTKRAGAKRTTVKRATTKRAPAKASRIAKKPAQTPRRATTTGRASAKRTTTRPKRATVKRTTKRGAAKRTTKRSPKRAAR